MIAGVSVTEILVLLVQEGEEKIARLCRPGDTGIEMRPLLFCFSREFRKSAQDILRLDYLYVLV